MLLLQERMKKTCKAMNFNKANFLYTENFPIYMLMHFLITLKYSTAKEN